MSRQENRDGQDCAGVLNNVYKWHVQILVGAPCSYVEPTTLFTLLLTLNGKANHRGALLDVAE